MKKAILLFLLMLFVASTALAIEPTKENLMGKWNLSFKGTMINEGGVESDVNATLPINIDTVTTDDESVTILRDSAFSGDYLVFVVIKYAEGKSNGTFNMSLSYTSGSSTLSAKGTLFLKTGTSGKGIFNGTMGEKSKGSGDTITTTLFSGTLSLARP